MGYSVLIVEDNNTKRIEIENSLPSCFSYEVQATPSIAQAYRVLSIKPYDLVILDMTFQVSQGKGQEMSKEAMAGVELLQYMARSKINSPVIVATQHSVFSSPGLPTINSVGDLDDLLSALFPENYRTTVQVDLSEETWKTRLQAAVTNVLTGGQIEGADC